MPPQRRLTRGEMKKKEEMEHLSLVHEELAEKLSEERSKVGRIKIENDSKTKHLKSLKKKLDRLQKDQHLELENR